MGEGRVLLLGGTGEARELAAVLVAAGTPVVSSLAGRVRDPRLPLGDTRIGGFGGVDGLREWLQANDIRAVVDATHPFAARITEHAVIASSQAHVPLMRLIRPPWIPGPEDRWTMVPDIAAAADIVADRRGRVLLTTGRQDVHAFAGVHDAWFAIRVVDEPAEPLPPNRLVLRSRGPYRLDTERALFDEHRIDLLVTKNSGGTLTDAKLTAAAERGIEVVMVERPAEPASLVGVDSVDDAAAWIDRVLRQ